MSIYKDTSAYMLPNSQDAEKSVLGSMIKSTTSLNLGMEKLKSDDFYYPHHIAIFDAMRQLFQTGRAVDIVTLDEALNKSGQLSNFGGMDYIFELLNFVPTTVNFEHYMDIVLEKSTLRKLIDACGKISTSCYQQNQELSDVLALAEKSIFDIVMQRTSSERMVHISSLLSPVFSDIEENFKNPGKVRGVPTGFKKLDRLLTGLHEGELILIGARPSMGKTSFAINVAQQAAKAGKTTAVFSLEMPNKQIVTRILCSEARVNMQNVRLGHMENEDWRRLAMAGELLYNRPLYLDDSSSLTPSQLRSRLRRLMMDKGVDLVVIDYLQLMSADGRPENRQLEVGEISRRLKSIALELKIPIIACAQLSRATTSRADKRPVLSDLRDSGSIEQDADVVMFLHRETYYNTSETDPNKAEVIIAKQRNGPTETVEFYWQSEFTTFDEMTD